MDRGHRRLVVALSALLIAGLGDFTPVTVISSYPIPPP